MVCRPPLVLLYWTPQMLGAHKIFFYIVSYSEKEKNVCVCYVASLSLKGKHEFQKEGRYMSGSI